MITRVIVAVLAVFLSFHALRTAVASLPADRRPFSLERIWPTHPAVITDRIMATVGDAAARGAPPAPALREDLREAARRAPLAVEPFLVEGALAQLDGRDRSAEKMFVEARRRDPRSAAARYFLGSRYLQTDRVVEGLAEIAQLSRLLEGAQIQFVPALAQYARSPGAVPRLKQFFRSSPGTEDAVLERLAADARNADLILELASSERPSQSSPAPPWPRLLIAGLVEQGNYVKARTVWSRLTGASSSPTLVNPAFGASSSLPPFDWTFYTGKAGVAEPGALGLKVVYFGRDDAILASRLLVLPQGTYQFASPVGATAKVEGLGWSLTCQPGKQKIMSLPIGAPDAAVRFTVPGGGCAAQLLELMATSSEGAQPVEVSLPRLVLTMVGGR